MLEAGVDLVTVGVFSWAHLEAGARASSSSTGSTTCSTASRRPASASTWPPPRPRRRHGSPHAHPEMLPMTRRRHPAVAGRPAGLLPELAGLPRARRCALCRGMAERYAAHPALRLWHVGNELRLPQRAVLLRRERGGVPGLAARAVRRRRAPSTMPGGPRSGPSATPTSTRSCRRGPLTAFANPTQQLDFRRFSSDELLANFVAERDVLHELSPGDPGHHQLHGHRALPRHGLLARGRARSTSSPTTTTSSPPTRRATRELAFCADLTRGLAGGGPWLLMEQSPSAVNWQPRNIAASARGAAAQQPPARRPRRRRRSCSSSGGPPGGRGEVPRRAGAARRHRHPGLARGRRAEAGPRPRWTRSSGSTVRQRGRASSSTSRPGGPASSTPTPASTSPTSTGPTPSTAP